MIRTILMAVGLSLVVTAVAEAKHDDTCAARDVVAKVLDERLHQVPVAMGLIVDGMMLEIYASADGAWTLLVTEPSGESCVKGKGTHWQLLEVVKGITH